MLAYIDIGTPVAIYSDISPDSIIEAEISRISPYLHEVTRTTRAEIHIDDSGDRLRPGMFVTVDVLYGESDAAPLVPNSAIFRHPRDGREGMFITDLSEALTNPEAPAGRPDVVMGEPVGPVLVRFVPVDVIARGRMTSGVRGVAEGAWAITLGHNLLSGTDEQQAIVQPMSWEHILDLQQMESRDLLEIIRGKQQIEMGSRRQY
jgi:multidrug efflux pump subunit AcrA (membrane-fusion protein)